MSNFDDKTLSIIAKLGASTQSEIKPIGCPKITGETPRIKMAHSPMQLSHVQACPPAGSNCPTTAYAQFNAPVLPEITPICDTGPLVRQCYQEAFGMAMQLFQAAAASVNGQNDVSVVASQAFTGARIP